MIIIINTTEIKLNGIYLDIDDTYSMDVVKLDVPA